MKGITSATVERIQKYIFIIRGQRVILDTDLAEIYGIETKNLNKAVKRNPERFPSDFVFLLTRQEVANLRFQFGTSSGAYGGRRYPPFTFTEHGAIMAANVLRSTRAVQMSVFVVRAFVKMRSLLTDTRDLSLKLDALEDELKNRLDVQEAAIVTILQRVMNIIDPPTVPDPPKKEIGFHVKEPSARYLVQHKCIKT